MKKIECKTQAEFDKAIKKHGDDSQVLIAITGKNIVDVTGNAGRFWEGKAEVRAYGSSTVRAYDSSTVTAYGSSTVTATGSSTVTATGSSTVTASKFVAVHLINTYGKPNVTGGVQIVVPDLTNAQDWCDYYGVETKRGRATVYKAVDDNYLSGYKTSYKPGAKPSAPDWLANKECGNGLHFSPRPYMALRYATEATKFVACTVAVKDMVILDDKCKAPKCNVLREVDQDGEPI